VACTGAEGGIGVMPSAHSACNRRIASITVVEKIENTGLPVATRDSLGGRLQGVAERCLPELLAPAGNWACARAAVLNGADAVYFALGKFNARIRAENFAAEDLPRLMEYLHKHGVRGYGCLNTIVFEDELGEAEACLRAMISAGVDAVLVQDVGIARLVRRISTDFPIHASTQMTITSAAGVEFAKELGCSLVVLARECSVDEIAAIRLATRGFVPPISLEVFVHGALCISYSGQCFASRALGGRSANRGDCAQVCRLPYALVCDGRELPLGDRKYLLSAQDLAALELLPDLVRTGVASLKIEGRLKSPEYVAAITRIYRSALDELVLDGDGVCSDRRGCSSGRYKAVRYEMGMAFSRGLCAGWLKGVDQRTVVHGRFGKHRGVCVGKVVRVRGRRVVVQAEIDIKPGDGLVFESGTHGEDEAGGRVYNVRVLGETASGPRASGETGSAECDLSSCKLLELGFGNGPAEVSRVKPGAEVWKTSDPELEQRWRALAEGGKGQYKRPIWFEVCGSAGGRMELTARDEHGNEATAVSAVSLCPARSSPLTEGMLVEQLGRLGGTQFRLDGLKSRLPAGLMLPVSELNRLRREVVAELERVRARPKHWQLSPANRTAELPGAARSVRLASGAVLQLAVLVRNLTQFKAAMEAGVRVVYCEFESLDDYRTAVEQRRHYGGGSGAGQPGRSDGAGGESEAAHGSGNAVFAVLPRIFKQGEEGILETIRASGMDGYLVRNYDHLKFFKGERCVGDFSFNTGNSLAAEYFKNRFGLERVTASYDMDVKHLELLLRAVPPEWIEITVYQHIPMLHMAHCMFCAFMSQGRNRKDCGRPCRQHEVRLRDRLGEEHPVRADVCCRNTVFQGRPKSAAEHLGKLIDFGARCFRLELLDEDRDETVRLIRKYSALLSPR